MSMIKSQTANRVIASAINELKQGHAKLVTVNGTGAETFHRVLIIKECDVALILHALHWAGVAVQPVLLYKEDFK